MNFISEDLVRQLSCVTFPLSQPLVVKVANGQSITVRRVCRLRFKLG